MVWHRCQPGALSSPKLRRLTAGVNTSSVSTGCVGHTSVHSDSGSRAWGPEVVRARRRPRCVDSSFFCFLLTPSPWLVVEGWLVN